MMYIRVSFIILATLSFLMSPVVSAPVGFISSTKLVDRSTVPDDDAINNNSIEMLLNKEVLGAKLSKKTTNSNMREICSLFKFSNFEKILCFNINNDELKKYVVN